MNFPPIRLFCQPLPSPCPCKGAESSAVLPLPLPPHLHQVGKGSIPYPSPPCKGWHVPWVIEVPYVVSHYDWPRQKQKGLIRMWQQHFHLHSWWKLKSVTRKLTSRQRRCAVRQLHPIKCGQPFLQRQGELIWEAPPVVLSHLVLESVKDLKWNASWGSLQVTRDVFKIEAVHDRMC